MVKSVDVLISLRETVGVALKNPFVFAAPTRGSMNCIRGYQAIVNTSKLVPNLDQPELIRSTKLRKYIATVSQVLSLNANELEWLATHMGHSLDVHKEYYRLHDSTLELAKISKLLMAIDNGQGKNLVGKELSQIGVDGELIILVKDQQKLNVG